MLRSREPSFLNQHSRTRQDFYDTVRLGALCLSLPRSAGDASPDRMLRWGSWTHGSRRSSRPCREPSSAAGLRLPARPAFAGRAQKRGADGRSRLPGAGPAVAPLRVRLIWPHDRLEPMKLIRRPHIADIIMASGHSPALNDQTYDCTAPKKLDQTARKHLASRAIPHVG